MTSFKLVSWIARSKRKQQIAQLGVFDRQLRENLKPGWFYWKSGRLIGPFNDVELFDLLDKGELQKDSLVTLMDMPVATLLKDPTERIDFHAMVQLKKPGLENAAATGQDAVKHVMATHSTLANVPNETWTTWLFPKPAAAKKNRVKPGWFYWKSGRLTGPFNDVELFDLLDNGDLQEDSLVTFMDMPLAMLLKDPAKRLYFLTMVYLKKPSLENSAATRQDAAKHVVATDSAVPKCWSAWIFPKPTTAKTDAEDLAAFKRNSEKAEDNTSGVRLKKDGVDDVGSSKKILTSEADPGYADAYNSESAASEMDDKTKGEASEIARAWAKCQMSNADAYNSESAASEMDDKTKVEASEIARAWAKCQMSKKKPCKKKGGKDVMFKAAVSPRHHRGITPKAAATCVDYREQQLAKPNTERKGASKHPRDVFEKNAKNLS